MTYLDKLHDVVVLQIENRIDPFFESAIKLNKSYCDQHQIVHIIQRSGYENIPPYWWKVFAMFELLKTKKYDIVCWIDSDAYVYNTKYDIRLFFDNNVMDMIICSDPPPWTSKFMAAVFMVKNSQTSINIFKDWLAMYNPSAWQKISNDKWQYIGRGEWAGSDYEQGAFVEAIMSKYKTNIKILPWYVFHETNFLNPHSDCWSIHIPGALANVRNQCMISMKNIEQMNILSNKSSKHVHILIFLFVVIILIISIIVIIHNKKI